MDIIISTKGYKNNTLEPLIKKLNKQVYSLYIDTDLEHSCPPFLLDTSVLMMIYTQIEFGCKRLTGLELIKDIVETVIFWLYKPVTLTLKIESPPPPPPPPFFFFFAWHSGSWWCTTIPSLVTKECKQTSAEWEQICVTRVTSLTPEDITVLSLF